ncbi:MAG: flagellar motor stator protein MotA [Acidobacteria bacterium]|nr:flagellar motor stator protein MotA [Acidobacteriota bacterium]
MTAPIGFLMVLISVLAGYMAHGGKLGVLYQPSEFLIIGGAAIGSMVIGTPMAALKALGGQLGRITKPAGTKAVYLDLLTMLYNLFRAGQQAGAMALETHAEKPKESSIFKAHPEFLARHHAVEFLCDSLKVMIMGGVRAHDFDELMEEDLEVHHKETLQPSESLSRMGDTLPGLGIVAAVLGVCITMGAIDGSPAEIGEKIAAALVGTFLGVFLAYGFVNPLAATLGHRAAAEALYLECIKTGILAIHKGLPPVLAVEFARRVLPEDVRPSFEETERACRGKGRSQAAAAA